MVSHLAITTIPGGKHFGPYLEMLEKIYFFHKPLVSCNLRIFRLLFTLEELGMMPLLMLQWIFHLVVALGPAPHPLNMLKSRPRWDQAWPQ